MFQAETAEKIKTHILSSLIFFENGAVYNNVGGKGKRKIAAIPLQQWLRESATVLSYTHNAFLLYDGEVKEAVHKWLYEPTEKTLLGTFWEA